MEEKQRKLLFDSVSPLVGSIYSIDPTITSSTSSSCMAGATRLGFACLVGESGESLVSSSCILRFIDPFSSLSTPDHYLLEFPCYHPNHTPLLFPAQVAFFKNDCEVCILKPSGRRRMPTRCIDICFDDESLEEGDALFCFDYPDLPFTQKQRLPTMIQGALSLPPHPSYGLIAAFGLSMTGGIVTNLAGEIVGSYCSKFTVEEGDQVHECTGNVMTRKVMIKETADQRRPHQEPRKKNFSGMPQTLLKHVQQEFAVAGPRRKQESEQSRIFPLSQARQMLMFFNKKACMTLALRCLFVKDPEPVYMRRLHKRKRFAYISPAAFLRKAGLFKDDDDDENEDDCTDVMFSPRRPAD